MSKELQVKIPWEECPKNFKGPVWRYSKNPVIDRNPVEGVARIFNSALLPYKNGYIGVFRGETTRGNPLLYLGRSKDGIHFTFDKSPAKIVDESGKQVKFDYAYDPRLIKIEDTYYIVCCINFRGPTLMVAETKDFKKIVKLNNPFLPMNRNGVLFPRKINGYYHMLSRPSDSGHTPFGDIFISKSKDMKYWGDHKLVMCADNTDWWNGLKIGAGANPIEIKEGWLLLFHGVVNTCNGYVYSWSGAILDKNDPSKVLYRCKHYMITPEMSYETVGFVPNVTFPTSALVDKKTGRVAIYYGGADTYTCLCFSTIDRLVDFIKKNS